MPDEPTTEGVIAGRIGLGEIPVPNPDVEPRPLFTIIRANTRGYVDPDLRHAPPETRPCEHGAFVLDDQWLTVTCGKCRTRVEPYAALRHFADWWPMLQGKLQAATRAEHELHVARLREL